MTHPKADVGGATAIAVEINEKPAITKATYKLPTGITYTE